MNKKQLKKAIELIETMAQNDFLMPLSHSDQIFTEKGFSYKTYKGDCRTYINIDIIEKNISLLYRRGNLRIEKDINFKISNDKILQYLIDIFEEKHSFKNISEGKKDLMKKIVISKNNIRSEKKKLSNLEKELKDYDKIKK